MKILDRYILKSYLATFLSVLVILMLIFVLQAVWLYISELAGKDLDIDTIFKFLIYVIPSLIPLILPLTILLSSIMVFGSFAENYEFAAMKSTGISLQRAMFGLSIFILGLSITTFFFANNVIPHAEYNSYNLRKNIAKVKPAMAIAEGQFNEVGNFNIKVASKSGDRGQFLHKVVMHELKPNRTGNFTVIVADSGELRSAKDSNILQLLLFNGNYYEEVYSSNPKEAAKRPHVKSFFDTYTINVDLEELNGDVNLEEKSFSSRYNMMDVSGLNYTIDSLKKSQRTEYTQLAENLYSRTTIGILNTNIMPNETAEAPFSESKEVLDIFDNSNSKVQTLHLALNTINSTTQMLATKEQSFLVDTKWKNKHIIALHEKYALGIACFILFFVGAPLGALIRKGGIGLPLVIAIMLFLTYHFIGLFAKNSAENDSLNPIIGTWLSTVIMMPLGIFLTRRATNDKGLFDFDTVLSPIKKFLNLKPKYEIIVEGRLVNYSFVDTAKNEQLFDYIKNYESLGYDQRIKAFAYNKLDEQHVSLSKFEEQGIHITEDFLSSKKQAASVKRYSRFAMITYIISLVLTAGYFIMRNNKMPEGAALTLKLTIGLAALTVILVIIMYSLSRTFYKNLKPSQKPLLLIGVLLGLPFYGITHYFVKRKIKEDLDTSCLQNVK